MNTVRQVLSSNRQLAAGIPAETPLPKALKWMEKNQLEAAPVIEDGQLAGLVTSTACAREIGLHPHRAASFSVAEVMDHHPDVIQPEQSIEECAEVMARRSVYHLPVVEGNCLIGMVSIRDVLEALITSQQDKVHFLEDLMLDYDPV